MCLVAAVASLLRGKRYIYDQDQEATGAVAVGSAPTSTAAQSVLKEDKNDGLATPPGPAPHVHEKR